MKTEFKNFMNGNYYKPNEDNNIPSLYRDYQIFIMNQISEFTLIQNDEDKIKYYWLKSLDDPTFKELHFEFLKLKNNIEDFKESFVEITSPNNIDLSMYFITHYSYENECEVNDTIGELIRIKVDSIISNFIKYNESPHTKIFQHYFIVGENLPIVDERDI